MQASTSIKILQYESIQSIKPEEIQSIKIYRVKIMQYRGVQSIKPGGGKTYSCCPGIPGSQKPPPPGQSCSHTGT